MTKRNGDSLLLDWSTLHETSPSYLAAQLKYMRSRADLEWKVRSKTSTGGTVVKRVSPELLKRQRDKHKKYIRLVQMANHQRVRGLRKDKVSFLAPIFSHGGEFSSDVFEVVEWLCKEAYSYFKDTVSSQPLGPKIMVSRFRCELLDSLAVANARGVGMMLLN